MQKSSSGSSRIKILVCCHKKCELPQDDIFLPIQVGAAISDVDLGMQRDDQVNGESCDNISSKNKSYCELTALYWAWKNIRKLYPDLEYIGLCHYRRYFDFNRTFFDMYVNPESQAKEYKINKEKLAELLKKYTVLPKTRGTQYSLAIDYCKNHISDDYRTLKQTLNEIHPDYSRSFNKVMEQNNLFFPYNMFIIPYKLFENYCSWLFELLEATEKKIDISSYNTIQKRIFGYMAERLFNVWIYHNNIKIKNLPIIFFSDDKKMQSPFDYVISKLKCRRIFKNSLSYKTRLKFCLYKLTSRRRVLH